MAYVINIPEWSSNQVLEWLKGLDNAMYQYMEAFSNNHVDGERLINLRSSTLEAMGIECIGHQEIILEAVEHLRNFHYNIDKENLQYLALQVATAARSLYKELEQNREKKTLDTDALMDITRTLAKIKPLICWLDRPPFKGQQQYLEIRKKMLTLALEMAISAQRDRFALKPVEQIIQNAEILAKLSDYIIQVISDPLLLQPASLILVTLKKKESDLGFYVSPSFHGIYRVTDIKFNSPAHVSGKIAEGDEVVQINYQTVVGWQHKKVLLLLHDCKPDVLLTMKKRPKHVKIYGQVYMKPYRLPSKKRSTPVRWGEGSSPILSRPLELLPSVKRNYRTTTALVKPESIPEDRVIGESEGSGSGSGSGINSGQTVEDDIPTGMMLHHHEDSDSDLMTPTETKMPDHELHLLFQTSRPFLQRRNTVCGDESERFKYLSNVKFWQGSSQERRDKSISMGFGMESTTVNNGAGQGQPQGCHLNGSMPDILTTMAMTESRSRGNEENDTSSSNCDIINNKTSVMTMTMMTSSGGSKCVRFDEALAEFNSDDENKRKIELSAFDAIPFADNDNNVLLEEEEEEEEDNTHIIRSIAAPKPDQPPQTYPRDDPPPPAIEPRKEQQIAPTPPPRPKKPIDMSPSTAQSLASPIPPPRPLDSPSALKSPAAMFGYGTTAINSPKPPAPAPTPAPPPKPIPELPVEAPLELVMPVKQKSLTLKKKNSILAKRRKIAVKALPHSDIQGHLYRRTKDKSGTSYWAKGYFVLTDNALYCFRAKDAVKADFLVFLSGFTVSLASEIHSKPFAFKVYHALKTLYFAAESQEALTQWVDYLRRATNPNTVTSSSSSSSQITDIKEIFTETESSEEDSEEHDGQTTTTEVVVKHEKYHLGLGSLKKFTKSNNPFSSSNKNSADKKHHHNDLPIPTAQFRSYKKVQGYAGLSPGNHFFPPDSSLNNHYPGMTATLNPNASSTPLNTPGIVEAINSHQQDKHRPLISPITPTGTNSYGGKMVATLDGATVATTLTEKNEDKPLLTKSPSKKFQPHNYIHASNPNLVDFECQLGDKPSQFSYETSGSLMNGSGGSVTVNGTNGGHSLQGCMTLMDLMLQQQADDAKEVYNNRVFLGEEKADDQRRRRQRNDSNKSESHAKIIYGGSSSGGVSGVVTSSSAGGGGNGDQKIDKIQSRTLPKTPDYAQSFKPDDVDILMIRSKEGQSLRNFGYEFISEEDPQEFNTQGGGISAATLREKNRLMAAARKTDKVSPTTSWSRRKGLNWINSSDKQQQQQQGQYHPQHGMTLESGSGGGGGSQESAGKLRSGSGGSGSGGSFKKHKGLKFDSLKSTDRFFSFNKIVGGDAKKSQSSPGQSPSHSTGGGGGGTLPILSHKNKGNLFNLTDAGGMMKKLDSSSSSSSALDAQARKLSSASTASYFSKLSFAGSGRSSGGGGGSGSAGVGGGSGGGNGGGAASIVSVAKEKKIFGSPRLHRAIFGKVQQQQSHTTSAGNRSPIFDEVILGQGTPSWMDTRREVKAGGGIVVASNMPDLVGTTQLAGNSSISGGHSPGGSVAATTNKSGKTPEYPGMECPPVFRPETYSLSDPSTSNTLRRRNNNQSSNQQTKKSA